MMSPTDPILDEVHAIREELAKQSGYDAEKIAEAAGGERADGGYTSASADRYQQEEGFVTFAASLLSGHQLRLRVDVRQNQCRSISCRAEWADPVRSAPTGEDLKS